MDITIPVVESQEDQEDAIDFHYFHAEIVKDSLGGEVRITAASEAAIIILRPVSTPVEILWYQLKEVFVNQIFINSKQNKGIRIRSFILESYYNWVNRARGVLTKTSLSYKVRWFLSELLVVAPNSSIRKMGQLLEPNKQKLLKQYLLTNMDTMVLNLKTVATKLKSMKTVRPEMEQLFRISESGIAQVENYSFLRHLLADLFDEDEVINQHIALLDHIHAEVHATYQEILIEGVQKHLEKSGEEDSSYYDILIADLQRNLKNVDKGENLLGKTKENDLSVAEFISDTNGGRSEFETRNVKAKKDREAGSEKIEDFEYFILTEIEKAVKYSEQNILQKYEGTGEHASKNVATESKRDKDAVVKSDEITSRSSQNRSKGEDRKSKVHSSFQEVMDFLRVAHAVDAKLERAIAEEEQKKERKSSADSLSETNDAADEKTDEKRTLTRKIWTGISDTQRNRETTYSKAKSSNQGDAIESKVISTDPKPEKHEESVWATKQEKDSPELQIDKDKDEEAKPKTHIAKHIDDEL